MSSVWARYLTLKPDAPPLGAEKVINAAVFRGWKTIQDALAGFKTALEAGQLSLLPLREMQNIPLEITYEDVKYSFTVSPRGPDTILLSLNGQEILVKILQQADGSLFVSYGRESHRVFAREEPLGLRMVLGGVTNPNPDPNPNPNPNPSPQP